MRSKSVSTSPAKSTRSNKLKIDITDLCYLDPLTKNQELFFKYYKNGEIMILFGSAGTGKTMISMYKALEDVLDKKNKHQKLYIIRSAVPTRDLGHLPGDIDEKTEIYSRPYYDIASFLFGIPNAYQRLVEQGVIEFMTTSHIRGITLSNCVILVDEIQNLTDHELNSIITRLGDNAKLILCGDIRQTDLNKKHESSGFKTLIGISKYMNNIIPIEFGIDDIVRSRLVKDYIISRMKYEDEQNNIKSI